jgi:plasmid stabilization system protein ParE
VLYQVVTTANARRDIQDAIDWENNRDPKLGKRFLAEIEQKLLSVSHTPRLGSIRYENVRCLVTNVFSYLIHYTVDDNLQQIIVLRVLHTSRKPVW